MAESRNKSSRAFEVWALGVVTANGGQMFAWNAGLVAGTLSYGMGVFLIGMAYLCMVFSIAEVASVVAFRGGVYGLARCTLGFYFGYVAGCCELLEYALFLTTNSIVIAQILAAQWPALAPYTPLVCLMNQVLSFGVVILGGRVFWRYIVAFAMLIAVVLFLYAFSAVTTTNTMEYAGGTDFMIVGGFLEFLAVLPQATWMFSGIEALTTLGNDVTDPKRLISKGQVAAMWTLLATALCIFLTSISSPPGIQVTAAVPAVLNGVFTAAFNITDASATLLSLPTLVGSTTALVLPASNIVVAMAQSKLIPSKLADVHPRLETNVNALVALLVVTSAMCVALVFADSGNSTFFDVCLIFGLLAYIAQCAGFVYLRRHHKHMPRLYMSPVGIPGAVFSMAVFGLTIVSVLFCQRDDGVIALATMAALALLSLFYHIYAKHHQTLSDDEHALFFAHVGTSSTNDSTPHGLSSKVQCECAEKSRHTAVVPMVFHRALHAVI
ncbi:unnamed protein product [Aphanomyces euteiches]